MLKDIIKNKRQIHTRNINLVTFPHGDSKIIVQGTLLDERHQNIFDITGDVLGPGPIHHIQVQLLISSDPLCIEQAQAQMIHVPMEECCQTLDLMSKIEGMVIQAGFTSQIKKIMGGKKGCTHLCHLITDMAQEIVHGWLTYKRKDKLPAPDNIDELKEKDFLINSCRMWTVGGPKMKSLEKEILKKKAEN